MSELTLSYQLCQSLLLVILLCVRGRRLLLADVLRLRDEGGSVLTRVTSIFLRFL
jgi:hypothetical protein